MARSTFTRAARRSTFKCDVCGHVTRVTSQPDDSHLCAICWDLAGIENAVHDGCFDDHLRGAATALFASMTKRGGDVARTRKEFRWLVAELES